MSPVPHAPSHRREFLKTSTAYAIGSALIGGLSVPRGAHAGGDDTLRVGLIGCGGRGTGAAAQALRADPNVRLTALGDTFRDRLESSLASLRSEPDLGEKIAVEPDCCFVGFDAYKQVIDSVDVVVLTSPPHFRPAHLEYAVAQGKHVFAEKPVAVDAPGVHRVLAAVEQAKQKNLSLVSGLCWRYDSGVRETVQRVRDGAIGDIVAIQANYNTGGLWHHGRQPEWSDMEWQVRNWLYFTWLSGDHNVEQHVHTLDKGAWLMGDVNPVRAVGLGGRQVRVEEKWGNIFDHHAVVYEFAGGVRMYSYCRQQDNCTPDNSCQVLGTKGQADILKHVIQPKDGGEWQYQGPKPNMYQVEHNELFASIRSGQPINNGHYMTLSTMIAILGRMCTYTGQAIAWDDALASKEDLTPPAYEWGPLAMPPVAKPGITEFV